MTTTTFALNEVNGGANSSYTAGDIVDLKVFKSGTFKDSLGNKHVWTEQHLDQMVSNFTLLRQRGIFAKVPVRTDHTTSIKDVVGWVSTLRREGPFLHAGVQFTEPDAEQKYHRGTFGPRSSEVGMYETNGDAPETFYPVFRGLAFVDVGAVEGLFSQANQNDQTFIQVLSERNDSVSGDANGQQPAPQGGNHQQQAPNGTASTSQGQQPPSQEGGQQQAPSNHGSGQAPAAPVVHTFQVGGQPTTDFGAVQAHINELETFRSETTKVNRESFVDNLVSANCIAVTQKDSFYAMVGTMNVEQFEAFKKGYEGAPAMQTFANHGAGSGPAGAPNVTHQAGGSTKMSEYRVAEQSYDMLKRSGMSEEQLAKSGPGKTLERLRAAGVTA